MRSVGSLLPETIGPPTDVFLGILARVLNFGIRGGFWPEESRL